MPPNESERLAALRRYYILDTPPEAAFDRITALAARLFNTPISTITLVDETRQWFKSSYGLDIRETPREVSFCAYTILSGEVMVVPDTLEDERFAGNPVVVGPPYIRYYVGAPLKTPEGDNLGTLCVMDRVPRPAPPAEEQSVLAELAKTVMDELELRLATIRAAEMESTRRVAEERLASLSEALDTSANLLRSVVDVLPIGVWVADAGGDILLENEAGRRIWGGPHRVREGGYDQYKGWWAETGERVKPEEWAIHRAIGRGETSLGEVIDIEDFQGVCKTILNSAAPIRDAAGRIAGAVIVNEDITVHKQAERELRRRERQLDILSRASRHLNSVLQTSAVGRETILSALQLVGATQGTAGFVRSGRMEFTEYCENGVWRPIAYSFGPGSGVPGRVFETKTTYISNDTEHDPYVVPEIRQALGFRNLIDVPILSRSGEFLGCFELHNTEAGRPFDQRDAEVLEGLAASAAVALENARIVAERAEAEESQRLTLETSPLGIATYFLDGRVRSTNPSYCRLFGYTEDELLKMNYAEMTHPEDLEISHRKFRDLADGRAATIELEKRYIRKDGSVVDAILRAGAVRSVEGNPLFVVATVEDITDRKRAEETLRASAVQFQAVFDSALDAIFILDENWNYVDANPATCQLLGVSKEEVLGKPLGSFADPADRNRLLDMFRSAAESGQQRRGTVRLMRRDGKRNDVEFSFSPNFLPGRHLGIKHDITDRVRLEAQLLQAQKMEAVGRLAGGVAHDFNNLLTIITGYTQMLLSEIGEADRMRASIVQIAKAGERAASLTRQLLAFSRRQLLKPEIVNLNSILTDTATMLRRLIGEDIELVTVLEPDLGAVRADAGQIEQVIMNLAVNARDAMPSGGKLIIETANVELEASPVEPPTLPPGPYVRLAVSDTGVGMAPETLPHIFEPFFTTKEQGRGTGLGLSTVYGIVKQSAGDVWVYSEPERGTTFKIYLPRISESVARQEPQTSPPGAQGTETILVVEDESAVRSLITQILKSSGYSVLEAENGEEALRICEQHGGRIDLAIADVVMPGMSGRELVAHIRRDCPKVRIIQMSGYTETAMMERGGLENGMIFIQKPFSPQILRQKVREALNAVHQ